MTWTLTTESILSILINFLEDLAVGDTILFNPVVHINAIVDKLHFRANILPTHFPEYRGNVRLNKKMKCVSYVRIERVLELTLENVIFIGKGSVTEICSPILNGFGIKSTIDDSNFRNMI